MFTIYEEIEGAWAAAYRDIQLSQDERGTFTEFLVDEEEQARTKAVVDLQPWLAILELGIEWLSYVHVALTNGLKDESGHSRYRATWALVGSAVSFGLSIRLLCISGFDTPARALSRSYTEALLLCLAVLDDPKMADAFVTSETDDQVKTFWHSIASPKNLHKKIIEIERKSGLSPAEIDSMTSWRREEYEVLSQSSHLSYTASVLTSRTQPLGEAEEKLAIGIWGMASEWSHRTVFYAAATTWYFSRYSYPHLIGQQPSEGLLTFDRGDEWQRKIVLGRDVLDGLVSRHWKQ
ncbi:hypothetical protein QCM77_19975 [Bradyrhizobium sp. SSUT18]|uniref:hypothetical protein n=1 Tax=Bradyrhizobium sp. SSUT18 TaxID=3040602 RepID=UPI00244B49E1|nr:hypothetical protein [Bradyrhizobium sp. SSUT18]MDH2402218.1 hypothetical protein [Bradyrhizobium sp. SSUT18]